MRPCNMSSGGRASESRSHGPARTRLHTLLEHADAIVRV